MGSDGAKPRCAKARRYSAGREVRDLLPPAHLVATQPMGEEKGGAAARHFVMKIAEGRFSLPVLRSIKVRLPSSCRRWPSRPPYKRRRRGYPMAQIVNLKPVDPMAA